MNWLLLIWKADTPVITVAFSLFSHTNQPYYCPFINVFVTIIVKFYLSVKSFLLCNKNARFGKVILFFRRNFRFRKTWFFIDQLRLTSNECESLHLPIFRLGSLVTQTFPTQSRFCKDNKDRIPLRRWNLVLIIVIHLLIAKDKHKNVIVRTKL